jgi:ribosomal protein S17
MEKSMKFFLTGLCALSFAFATSSFAQDKSTASKQSKEVQQETKTMTTHGTEKVSTDTVYGKIESFEAGKTIKVTIPGKIVSTKSFALDSKDETVNVAPNLKVGDWVSVAEKTDNNGHKTVTVKPSSEKHATHAKKTGE